MASLKVGKFKFSVETQSKVEDKAQQFVHTHFGIKGKPILDKDTGLPTVVERGFWQRFLPKSKQISHKTVYSSSGQVLKKSTYKGKKRISYMKYNDKCKVIESESISKNGDRVYHKYDDEGTLLKSEVYINKFKTKTVKTRTKAGRYQIEKYVDGKLRYKECPGTFNWNESPEKYLFNRPIEDDKFGCWISKTFDESGNVEKAKYDVTYKDANGVEKSYTKFEKEGRNMTQFNRDGSVKSKITYSRKLDEWHTYEKNPYWEIWTQTDAIGEKIGEYAMNMGGTVYRERRVPIPNGYKKEYADYRRLKASGVEYHYNDGSIKDVMTYFRNDSKTITKTAADKSKTVQILNRNNIETEFIEYDKYQHLLMHRKFDLSTKTKTETYYKHSNISGLGFDEPYQIHVTKNINGREETRYFDGKKQRINKDGSYYQYSSEQERMAEWFKQDKRTSNSGNRGGRSRTSGGSKTHTSSAGANETRTDFINRMNNFLNKKGRKILNDSDLKKLANILGIEENKASLLQQIGDKNNREAKLLYRDLCVKFHPDRHGNTQESQLIFQIVQGLRSL